MVVSSPLTGQPERRMLQGDRGPSSGRDSGGGGGGGELGQFSDPAWRDLPCGPLSFQARAWYLPAFQLHEED